MFRVLFASACIALLISGPEPVYRTTVSSYHEWVDHGISSAAETELADIVKSVFHESHHRHLNLDAGITLACRRLSPLLDLQQKQSNMAWQSPTIQFHLRQSGVTDAFVFPIVAHADSLDAAKQTVERLLRNDLAPMGLNTFGLTWNNQTSSLVAVFTRRLVQLAPFPMTVEPGSRHLLWGNLIEETSAPQLILATPGKATIQFELGATQGMFWHNIYFPEEPGEYMVELLAQNDGPQVANLFPVYVGVEPPQRPVLKVYPESREAEVTADLELQMLEMLNRERRKLGIPECAMDSELTTSARRHSVGMAAVGRLTHTPQSGEIPLRYPFVENVSMSTSLIAAHTNLTASPSHWRNIVDSSSNVGGVGIHAQQRPDGWRLLYISQRFARR